MENPFAIIFQTALLGLKRNWKDEELLQSKVVLFRKLLEKGYSKPKIRELASFIKTYVDFSNQDFNRKFDDFTEVGTENPKNMGIVETIIYINREEAKEIGKKIEREKNELIKRLETLFKLLQVGTATSVVAELEKTKEDFIQEFKALITEKSLKKLKQEVVTF